MIRNRTFAGGTVRAVAMLGTVVFVAGCAAPGSVSALSGISPLQSSAVQSSAVQSSAVQSSAVQSSAVPSSGSPVGSPAPASASPALSSDPGLGDTRPPCPFADFQLILGPNASPQPGRDAALRKPFGDVGVDFGPQQPGATVLWARLDVVVTDETPLIPPDPAGDLRSFAAAESARPDSSEKLTAGTDPHVVRVMLKPFATGRFVLPAAVLNALPTDVPSYTVYLVEAVDESVCFGATPDPSLVDSPIGSGVTEIAQLMP